MLGIKDDSVIRIKANIATLICAVTIGMFTHLANASDKSQADKLINLVTFEEPPYVFPLEESHSGLVVEIIEELMTSAGVEYNLTLLPPKRALVQAMRVRNTCVFPIERSQEREAKLRWISPILISRNGFFAHPDKDYKEIRVLNDVKEYRIGSVFGSGVGEYLASLGFTVDFATDNRANMIKLEHDRIDLWAVDTLAARHISANSKFKLDEAKLVFFTSLRAIGCNLEVPSELVTELNDTLAKMYQDGKINHIVKEYIR